MSLLDLLRECVDKGVTLSSPDGELQLSGPSEALTQDLVARIRAHRAELVERLNGAADGRARPPVRPFPARNSASHAQTRLWFADRYDKGGLHYHVSEALELLGPLDISALDAALVEIVGRHESLRSVFRFEDGRLETVISPPPEWILQVEQTSADPDAWLEAQLEKPFDLGADLMVRACLLKLEADRHLFMLTLHHIATDGWSMGILREELRRAYGAAVSGRRPVLPPVTIQYGDYAAWQRDLLQGERLDRLKDFWVGALDGAPQLHSLPLDRPRPLEVTYAGRVHQPPSCPDLARQLRMLGQSTGSTLFMVMETAFAALIGAWSREQDIVIATPSANRPEREFTSLIGFFVNTLVLRTLVDPAKPFTALLAENRRHILAAFEHQDLPFEMLVEAINPPRSTSHAPIFQIMFALANGNGETLDLSGLEVRPRPYAWTRSKFDLTLHAAEAGDDLLLEWEYNTDLFDAATVSSLAESFEALLRHVVEAPDTAVGSLRLTETAPGAAEAAQQEPAFCIHERFEAHAAAAPAAPAVVFEGETVSYGALNARANQLARVLTERGVRAERMVGLCLDRSPEMIVAILAVLKAGGCYVPLDPTYPEARLQHMLEDSGVDLVLTHTAVAPRLPACGATALVLDDPEFMADCAARNADDIPIGDVGVTPQSLAYMIYTSGSTGRPKGVLIEHRNLAGLMTAADRSFAFGSEDCWTLFHSYAFDFSVWEIWGALAYGGRLVIVPFETSRSPADFHDLLRRERVTVLNQTPSAFFNLSPLTIERETPLPLRYVVFGGEALEPSKLQPWFDAFGDRAPQLVNMYGITETTVHVTFKDIAAADARQQISNIGRPIPGWRALVVGEGGAQQPQGCPGELLVGGAGVARGYHRRPDLNERQFIPDPALLGERLYRSGDLVRQLPNGELAYMGRIDQQVKIRGFRIELGEIEDAINRCAPVANSVVSVVSVTGNRSGGKLLTAHLVRSAQGAALRDDEIISNVRAALSAELPDFMMPATFAFLPALPLTPNGKVDRRRLSEASQAPVPREFAAASTPLEAALVALYERVLEVTPVGVRDNLFALGADSIRVVQLAREAGQAGLRADVRDFFRHQTVEELAAFMAARSEEPPAPPEVDTANLSDHEHLAACGPDAEDCYPASRLQQLMLEKSCELGGVHGVYQPQHLFRIRGDGLDALRLATAINEMVGRHPALRSWFRRSPGGNILQVVGKPRAIKVAVTDLSAASCNAAAALNAAIRADLLNPFDVWADTFLMRFQCFRLGDDEWALLISSHHAIEDGWGFVEFTKSLFRRYFDAEESSAELSSGPVNVFKEHVALEIEAREDQARWRTWEGLLDDYRSMPPLEPVPPGSGEVSSIELTVDEAATQRLVAEARRLKVTVRTMLLVAFARALGGQIGTQLPTIDVVTNGRSPRLSDPLGAVGLFWNFLPVTVLTARSSPDIFTDTLKRLLEGEAAGAVPPHIAQAKSAGGDLTYAAFNFVQFHNQLDFEAAGYPSVSTVYARDRFHHPIKLTAGMALANDRLELALEFDPARISLATAKSVVARLLAELGAVAAEEPRADFRIEG